MDKQLPKMVYSFRLYLNSFASTVIVLDTLKQWFVCMWFSMLLSIVSMHVIPLGCRILKECWFASVMAWDIEYLVLNLFSVYSFPCKIFVCNLIFFTYFFQFYWVVWFSFFIYFWLTQKHSFCIPDGVFFIRHICQKWSSSSW